jgi:hypothetical protein
MIPQEYVDNYIFEDIKEILEDKEVDDELEKPWKDDLTKLQKFKKALQNLGSLNSKELKRADFKKMLSKSELNNEIKGWENF